MAPSGLWDIILLEVLLYKSEQAAARPPMLMLFFLLNFSHCPHFHGDFTPSTFTNAHIRTLDGVVKDIGVVIVKSLPHAIYQGFHTGNGRKAELGGTFIQDQAALSIYNKFIARFISASAIDGIYDVNDYIVLSKFRAIFHCLYMLRITTMDRQFFICVIQVVL